MDSNALPRRFQAMAPKLMEKVLPGRGLLLSLVRHF
jgi:hypothetical protein